MKTKKPLPELTKHAGEIIATNLRWTITNPHAHASLQHGDVVVMVCAPDHEHWLLRESDMTLHCLKDSNGQFVHLI